MDKKVKRAALERKKMADKLLPRTRASIKTESQGTYGVKPNVRALSS